MPGCGLRGAGLLDEHMVVEKLYALALHQIACDLGGRGSFDHLAKFRNALPVAVVVEETPGLVLEQVFGGIGAGLAHVALDALAKLFNVIGKEATDQHHTIACVSIHILGRDERMQRIHAKTDDNAERRKSIRTCGADV